MGVSNTTLVLLVVVTVLIAMYLFSCSVRVKCANPTVEGYHRSAPQANATKSLTPVDWYSSPELFPHRQAATDSWYQPFFSGNTPNPMNMDDHAEAKLRGDVFDEFRHDYNGHGPETNYRDHTNSIYDNTDLGAQYKSDYIRELPNRPRSMDKYATPDRNNAAQFYGQGMTTDWAAVTGTA